MKRYAAAAEPLSFQESHFTPAALFSAMLRVPTLPTGFIAPCLPTKAHTLPSGGQWLHEIKHDGFRIIARKDGARVRLFSRPERT
jgi:ATP-dependent DNA ligase